MPASPLRARLLPSAAAALLGLLAVAAPSPAVTINLNPAEGMSQQAIDGFRQGADLWEALLFDPIQVNLDIDFTALPAGVLGSTSSAEGTIGYASFRSALAADALSLDDVTAVSSLPVGTSLSIYLNRTSDNPNGPGSATPYVDADGSANNTTIRLNLANAKALGLLAPDAPTVDGDIAFSTGFTWDFDRSDGIVAGAFDFVGVAAHEIGHALGFVSGVDVLDFFGSSQNGGPFVASAFTYVAPLDLFRHSPQSVAAAADIDWTADTRQKVFSLDGGATTLGTFATGVTFGDGRQASHWKDSQGLGIMDPTAAQGELLTITALDLRGFDVMGFDLVAVPEPATWALLALAALALLARGGAGGAARGRLRSG